MTDRPIIFSGPMVRALLAERKTQTRRLATSPLARCAPGDRLWVRETCRAEEREDGADGVRYAADTSWTAIENTTRAADRWLELFHYRGRGAARIGNPVPSIHMPRWVSRLTLILTEVRQQSLQVIEDEDAWAEGVGTTEHWSGDHDVPREAFRSLWSELHGRDSWAANPTVVALTFRVICGNIDQVQA